MIIIYSGKIYFHFKNVYQYMYSLRGILNEIYYFSLYVCLFVCLFDFCERDSKEVEMI